MCWPLVGQLRVEEGLEKSWITVTFHQAVYLFLCQLEGGGARSLTQVLIGHLPDRWIHIDLWEKGAMFIPKTDRKLDIHVDRGTYGQTGVPVEKHLSRWTRWRCCGLWLPSCSACASSCIYPQPTRSPGFPRWTLTSGSVETLPCRLINQKRVLTHDTWHMNCSCVYSNVCILYLHLLDSRASKLSAHLHTSSRGGLRK